MVSSDNQKEASAGSLYNPEDDQIVKVENNEVDYGSIGSDSDNTGKNTKKPR